MKIIIGSDHGAYDVATDTARYAPGRIEHNCTRRSVANSRRAIIPSAAESRSGIECPLRLARRVQRNTTASSRRNKNPTPCCGLTAQGMYENFQ